MSNPKKIEFTEEDVDKLANLSRLALTDTEKVDFALEIAGVLGYVSQIQDAVAEHTFDRTSSESYSQKNIIREDVSSTPADSLNPDPSVLVSSAPRHADGYIKVKKILGGSE